MAAPTPDQLRQMNLYNRSLVLANGLQMRQQIYQETITNYIAGQGLNRNIPIKNVGLTTKLYLQIDATVGVGAAETQTLTKFGPANLLSNVTFSDYSNYQRINTSGIHLDAVAMLRGQAPFASAVVSDNPVATGSIFSIKKAPASYTAAGQQVSMIYEVPFAYSDTDLTGAVLSQVLNANAYLAFTINPNIFVTNTGNPVQGVFQSSTAQLGTMSNFTITIYQEFIDQLPQSNGVLMLPAIDLSNVYGLYNTVVSGLAANSDNPYNFTNYRKFLSTYCVYDNAGVLNAGTDVNRFKLQAANMTNIFDLPPKMIKLFERKMAMDDFPIGSYMFNFRQRPIWTSQNGNMQLLFNPSVVTSNNSQLLVMLEYIAELNQVAQAGSVLQ